MRRLDFSTAVASGAWGPATLALLLGLAATVSIACSRREASQTMPGVGPPAGAVLVPVVVTESVAGDSDDPAIWLHPDEPSQSLVLGTDKGGAIYVFDLDGRILSHKTFSGGARMNNVDIEYGMILGGVRTDIAAATDRDRNLLRVFRLPDMTAIDHGGIEMFEGEEPAHRRPMGVALYRRPADGTIYAIVSRKEGPSGSYLWQYRMEDDGTGNVVVTKVREFGEFSNNGEIEAVAVDDPLGYVYYADERAGIRKYNADPDAPNANTELALFGTTGFQEDREGISIYRVDDGTGYILVSDQQANRFHVFKRQGEADDPHDHRLVKVLSVSTSDSDGSEVTNAALNENFPAGLFVAMSDDRTFHFYSWTDVAGDDLVIAPDGRPAAR